VASPFEFVSQESRSQAVARGAGWGVSVALRAGSISKFRTASRYLLPSQETQSGQLLTGYIPRASIASDRLAWRSHCFAAVQVSVSQESRWHAVVRGVRWGVSVADRIESISRVRTASRYVDLSVDYRHAERACRLRVCFSRVMVTLG